ncbi:M48 family metallopeptidase [Solicola sp. PLA-1-18]|uniref:M48 metallopeptidase family protein n=1 Tax=Solicola sp. PLA-1-18 TaxID=3380532 RepID=UPI003B784B33
MSPRRPAPRSIEEVRPGVEVRRSTRRRRSVQAYREGGRIVVLVPAALTAAEEARWVDTMVARLDKRGSTTRTSDDDLLARARELSRDHLDGRAEPASVRWVDNQHTRWGSCTPADGTIRLSSRLRPMPDWVVDYVLVHELAHLLVASHGPDFWALVDRFPRTERARGYLEGWSAAGGRGEPTGSGDAD